MQNKALKTILTIALTAVITVIVFILLMPILGPRFMHPLMSGRMESMHGNSAAPSGLDYATERTTDNGTFKVSYSS